MHACILGFLSLSIGCMRLPCSTVSNTVYTKHVSELVLWQHQQCRSVSLPKQKKMCERMLPQKFLRQKGKQIRDCNRYIVDALKIDLRNMIDLNNWRWRMPFSRTNAKWVSQKEQRLTFCNTLMLQHQLRFLEFFFWTTHYAYFTIMLHVHALRLVNLFFSSSSNALWQISIGTIKLSYALTLLFALR